jgi:anthranilate phosphoribosyltransferase
MSGLKGLLAKLPDRIDLTEKEAEEAMREIMHGNATDAQIAAYLMGLRMKGETIEEITGSVRAMRELAIRVPISDPQVVDTCGTGGD